MTAFTLADLARIVAERAAASPQKSYTAKLIADGPARTAKKLGEEAVEAVIAAVQGDRAASWRKPPTCCTICSSCCRRAASRCRMSWRSWSGARRRSGLAEKAARGG